MNHERDSNQSDGRPAVPELTHDEFVEILARLVAVALTKLLIPDPKPLSPPPPGDPIQLLTPEELAERFQVKEDHLHDLVRRGSLPAVDIGRKRRFRRATVEKWLGKEEHFKKWAHETIEASTRRKKMSER